MMNSKFVTPNIDRVTNFVFSVHILHSARVVSSVWMLYIVYQQWSVFIYLNVSIIKVHAKINIVAVHEQNVRYVTWYLPLEVIDRPPFVHIGCGYGIPTLLQFNVTFFFHRIVKSWLNDTIWAGILIVGSTVIVLVLSPSPTLVMALTQNWYLALSMILEASKVSTVGLSIFLIGFD